MTETEINGIINTLLGLDNLDYFLADFRNVIIVLMSWKTSTS